MSPEPTSESAKLKAHLSALREFQSNTDSPVIAGREDDPPSPEPHPPAPECETPSINEAYPADWKHCTIHLHPASGVMHSDGDHSVRVWIEDKLAEAKESWKCRDRIINSLNENAHGMQSDIASLQQKLTAARAEAEAGGWRSMDSAPASGVRVLVHAPSLVHADFNPEGIAEGFWQEDLFMDAVNPLSRIHGGFICAGWDAVFDTYKSVEVADADGWRPLPPRPSTNESKP